MSRKSKAFLKRSAAAKLGHKRKQERADFFHNRAVKAARTRARNSQEELERIESLLGEKFESLSEARKALASETKPRPRKRKKRSETEALDRQQAQSKAVEYAITFHYDKGKDKKGRIKYFQGELRFFAPRKLSEEDAEEKATEIITGNIPNGYKLKAFVYEHSPEGRKKQAIESDIEKGDYLFAEEFKKTVKRIDSKGSKTRTRKDDLT